MDDGVSGVSMHKIQQQFDTTRVRERDDQMRTTRRLGQRHGMKNET